MANYLHGIHDEGAEHLHADKPGWTVITEAIDHDANDRSGRDYRHLVDRGFTPIVRLNNAHNGVDGTIPMQGLYAGFAKRCANFVAASQGLTYVIIGNEPNHLQERPNGQTIFPLMYAECFIQCYDAIKAVAPNVQVITAPVAPWDPTTTHIGNENGDWIVYFRTMLNAIERCDGIGLHTYTHGAGIHLITSSARMQPPFQHRRYEFRAYLDFLEAVPPDKRALPVFITETDQVDPWVDANTQWVQAAYAEINGHNQTPGTQKIRCLCLYRWKGDKWHIEGKNGVQSDFRAAVGKGYTSPTVGDKLQEQNFVPFVPNQSTSVPALPPPYPDDWDPRLTERGVKIERVLPGTPNTLRWAVTKGIWLDEQESQGRHHFYADVYADNQPVVGAILAARWPGDGYATFPMEAKPGEEPGANFPMSSSLNEFSFQVNEPKHPSDRVTGVGMGANGNPSIHTSTYIEWTLTRTPANTTPTPLPTGPMATVIAPAGANVRTGPGTNYPIRGAEPVGTTMEITGRNADNSWYQVDRPDATGWVSATVVDVRNTVNVPVVDVEPVEPAPSVPQEPPVSGDKWQRSRAFIARWEGGYQSIHNDRGNWTGCQVGKGELKGTNFGISACSYPHLDIRNLTIQQADAIYFRDYWQKSGADKLDYPLCLLVLDTAVLHGVSTAQAWLREVGPNPYLFAARRLRSYLKADNWEYWDEAWVLRVCELLEAMAT